MYWDNAKDELLKAINKPRFGLITDVDGTISPIVDVPDEARVTPRNLELLAELGTFLTLTAVVSGRAAEDVYRRVGLPGLVYIGNHGMERWQGGRVIVSPTVAAYRNNLLAATPEIKKILIEGMRFEDKGATLSVHYRQTDNPEQVANKIPPLMQAIAEKHGLHLTLGRMVFEFRPPVEIDKSTAFEELVKTYQLDSVLYLGDDTTDVAVFLAARRLRESGGCLAYGLGVESRGTPQAVLAEADYLVQEVAGVESFLAWLLKARMASST
ncbi:MAG: trehalose-phosphatase [Anaerolineales bacterium]|nr:trehalose-phosphatase [Anaerolineales bacterium]